MTAPTCQFCGAPGRQLDHRTTACEPCRREHVNRPPDPARTVDGLRQAAQLPLPFVTRTEPRQAETPLEWRRRAWKIVKALGLGGERFTTADVISRTGQAPEGNTGIIIEGLLMTAAHDHLTLRHLPTGEWRGLPSRPGTTTGTDHPDTSHAAALRVLPRTGTQRAAILQLVQECEDGLTDPQIQDRLSLPPNSERPRRVELVEGGWLRDSGRRVVHGGNEHIVWVAEP